MINKLRNNQKFPFDPRKIPVFYGWVIIFAGIVGIIMSIPGQTMGVSAFTSHLIESLGLSKVQLATTYMIGTMLSSLLITKSGKLYDLHGARNIAIVAGFMLGAVLIYNTKIDTIVSTLYGSFPQLNKSILTAALMVIGFFGIRFFGQGILTMVSRNMVMKWFDKKRGFANSIMGVFLAVGFSYSPSFFNSLIEIYSWKGAWFILALTVGVVFVFFAIVFFRDNPQDCGLHPDGKIMPQLKNRPISHPKKDYTLNEARKTYSFWIFNLTMALYGLYFTAITFWIASIFNLAGFDSSVAFSIFIPSTLISTVFTIFGSWLSDYVKLKYMLILNLLGMIVSTSGFLLLSDYEWAKWIVIVGNGITVGMYGIISAVTWPRFYGTKHLGAISGYAMSWLVLGSALGPFLFSITREYSKSYNNAIFVCLLFSVLLLTLSFKANNVNE